MRDKIFYSALMNRVLNRREFNRYRNIDAEVIEWLEKDVPIKTEILTENDKKLLDTYALKLYDGVDDVRIIFKGMRGLVKLLYQYRYDRSPYHILNDAKQREISYKNHKAQKKFDAFQKKVKKLENSINSVSKLSSELKELFGSDTLHVHQKDFQLKEHLNKLQEDYKILQKQLQDAYINPEQYVPVISEWKKISKEDIEFYLDNLNLHEKGTVIKSFTKAIK